MSSFKISPRILAHLGEDLIKNESIAILELIKNSYDACSNNCIVDFVFDNNKLSEIRIEDDGLGMNLDIIENVWLVIGTDYKKSTTEHRECERVPLGEKGIGRLGIHKLGREISLISKKSNSKEVELYIDWRDLESSESIEKFTVDVNENDNPKYFNGSTGTLIRITNLKTNWDKRQLREVYRAINSLNSPFDDTNDDFKVVASSNTDVFKGLPDFEEIKQAALYFAKCTIKGDSITNIKYEFKPWSSLTRIQSGRIKKTKDFEDFQLKLTIGNGRKIEYLNLDNYKIGTIEFEIAIFDNDAQILNYVNTEKKSIKDYLSDNGGIRVYRDGVRVYDYGEKENDWLGIDLKRVHRVGGNISNHIVIGAVKIEDRSNSSALKEKTNREGFVENEAYMAFNNAISFVLDLIVNERNIDKERLTVLYKKHKTIEPVLSDLSEVIDVVKKSVSDEENKEEILNYLLRINNQYIDVKRILIRSANAGLNLSIVIHEIEKLTSGLIGAINHKEFNKAVNITLQLEKIIQSYSVMIKPSSIKNEQLSDIVHVAIDNYEFRFIDHNIDVLFDYNELKGYYAKNEAVSVLTNLLDNSIFWLSYSGVKNRIISIFISDQFNGYNSIIISDNGPGFTMPTDIAVKPFKTSKPNSIGAGLGLHIADEMMNAMKGKLMFLDNYDVTLPKKVTEHGATKAIIALCFPIKK